MIPLTITVDEYAKCFVPAPEYLVLERLRVDFDTISRIAIPKWVSEGMRYQIGVGKVLAVSPYKTTNEKFELFKEHLKGKRYVGFAFHQLAECVMLPWLRLPDGCVVAALHIEDVAFIVDGLDDLEARQARYENNQKEQKGWS